MVGLTAFEPLGRLRTVPVLPAAIVVDWMPAPPLSSQPAPLKALTPSPGSSVYQLLSHRVCPFQLGLQTQIGRVEEFFTSMRASGQRFPDGRLSGVAVGI
jgi:hypothetical protein